MKQMNLVVLKVSRLIYNSAKEQEINTLKVMWERQTESEVLTQIEMMVVI